MAYCCWNILLQGISLVSNQTRRDKTQLKRSISHYLQDERCCFLSSSLLLLSLPIYYPTPALCHVTMQLHDHNPCLLRSGLALPRLHALLDSFDFGSGDFNLLGRLRIGGDSIGLLRCSDGDLLHLLDRLRCREKEAEDCGNEMAKECVRERQLWEEIREERATYRSTSYPIEWQEWWQRQLPCKVEP